MEILAKAAVAEINRRVDDSCAVLRLELSRSQKDIDTLKRKCQVIENELRKARGRGRKKVFICGTSEKLSMPFQSARGAGADVRRAEQTVTLQDADPEPPIQHTIQILEDGSEAPIIKEEGTENEPWIIEEEAGPFPFEHGGNVSREPAQETPEAQGQLPEDMEPQSTHFARIRSSVEQVKSDEEGTGRFRLHVKAEKEEEEERGRQGVVVEGAEQRDGEMEFALEERDVHLEFALEEREAHLWHPVPEEQISGEAEQTDKSFPPAQLSRDMSVFPQHLDTAMEQSGSSALPPESTPIDLYGTHEQPHAAWTRDRRAQADPAVQRLRHDGLPPGPTQPNALLPHHRTPARPGQAGAETSSQAGPGPAGQAGPGYSRGGLGAVRRLRAHWRVSTAGERRFSCSFCERRFVRFGQLKEHLRSHTGERPYTCTQCGRSFTKQGNLIRHAVVHSGEKPYQCSLCGKCFTQRSSLKSHQKTHTPERDGILQGLPVYQSVRDSHGGLSVTQTRGFL
ncbi:uncharacterized protein LOC143493198 isoform X2 [Brachyhypopomus gauderio]